MSQVAHPQLTALVEYPFPVFCSPGAEARARQLAARCASAHDFLRATLAYEASVCLLALGPEHWQSYTGSPMFGVPQTIDERTVVVAGQNSELWEMIIPPPDMLSAAARQAMGATYGLAGGGLSIAPYMDLLPVHELGHLFIDQLAGHFDHHAPRRWVVELFCNLCLHAYVAMHEPEQLAALEVFPRVIAEEMAAHCEHRSLHAFETLYATMEPPNFVWYLSRLHTAAKRIFDAGGIEALQRLYAAVGTAEGDLADERLAARLSAAVHPEVARVLTAW